MPRNRRRKQQPARAKRQRATAAPIGKPQAAAGVRAVLTASGEAIPDEMRRAEAEKRGAGTPATLGAAADPTGRSQTAARVTVAPVEPRLSPITTITSGDPLGALPPAAGRPQTAARVTVAPPATGTDEMRSAAGTPARSASAATLRATTAPAGRPQTAARVTPVRPQLAPAITAQQKTSFLTWLKEKIFGKPKALAPSIAPSTGSTVPSERPTPRGAEPRAELTRATTSPSRTGTPQTQQGQMVAHPVMIMHPSGRLIPTNMYLISVQPIPARPPALTHEQQFQSFANWAKKTIDDGVKKFDEHCRANDLSEDDKKKAIALAAKTKSEDLQIAANNRGLPASERKIASAAFTLRSANAEARAKISAEQQYFSQFDVGKTRPFGEASKAIAENSKGAVLHGVSSTGVSAPARAETRATPSRATAARTGSDGVDMTTRMTKDATFGSTLTPPSAGGRPAAKERGAGIRGGIA